MLCFLFLFFSITVYGELKTYSSNRALQHSFTFQQHLELFYVFCYTAPGSDVIDELNCACLLYVGRRVRWLRRWQLQPGCGGGALRQSLLLLPVYVNTSGRQHGRPLHADLSAVTSAALHSRCVSRDLHPRGLSKFCLFRFAKKRLAV